MCQGVLKELEFLNALALTASTAELGNLTAEDDFRGERKRTLALTSFFLSQILLYFITHFNIIC